MADIAGKTGSASLGAISINVSDWNVNQSMQTVEIPSTMGDTVPWANSVVGGMALTGSATGKIDGDATVVNVQGETSFVLNGAVTLTVDTDLTITANVVYTDVTINRNYGDVSVSVNFVNE